MKMFEDYLEKYSSERITKGSLRDMKRISLNAIKILAICEKINEELQQKQKIYVLVKLMDYISLGEDITENELIFYKLLRMLFISGMLNIKVSGALFLNRLKLFLTGD